MTPEAQRIAIAEACGWKPNHYRKCDCPEHWDFVKDYGKSVGFLSFEALPNYLVDLNAMHEAEKTLTAEQGQTWAGLLCDMTDRFDGDAWKHAAYSLAHATAAQRAEAFLKTLGKWPEPVKPRGKAAVK